MFCEDLHINQMDFYSDYNSSYPDIRLIIFLIASVCVGLPALVWACLHMRRHRGRISTFIIILLFSDLIELILNLFTVSWLLIKIYLYGNMVFQSWSALSLYGFHLHQLVALEGVLTLKYPLCSAHIFSLPCYIIIFILVLVFSLPSAFIFFMHPFGNLPNMIFSLGTSLAPLSLLAVTCTLTCKAPPTPVRKNTHSVFIVSMVTFVMLYLPFMLIICLDLFTIVHKTWYVMSVCLMSLRVISDPILCVLVCRNLKDVHDKRTQNADETSV